MASTKNVQALNSRLDQACRNRVGEFYRQHISSLAQLEHEKLDTARLLQAVRKCPSDKEALSIKFLGPPPKSGHHQRRGRQAAQADELLQQQQQQQQRDQADDRPKQQQQQQQQRAPPQTAAPPMSENPFAPPPVAAPTLLLERAKTFAGPTVNGAAAAADPDSAVAVDGGSGGGRRHNRQRRRRTRTPFPSKLEKFYTHLEDTKRGCGLRVVDSTQTAEARIFRGTLSRAEWRLKLAKLDPEYFKNLAFSSDTSSDESGNDGAESESSQSHPAQ